jgi:hypothetical protein
MKLVSSFDEIELPEKGDKAMGDRCYSTLVCAEKGILDAVFDCRGRDCESCLKRQAQGQVNVIRSFP